MDKDIELFISTPDGASWKLVHGAKEKWTIGRAPDCDIIFTDKSVSKHHATIKSYKAIEGFAWSIMDNDSQNGLLINTRFYNCTNGEILLREGDIIHLGDVILNIAFEFNATIPGVKRTEATKEIVQSLNDTGGASETEDYRFKIVEVISKTSNARLLYYFILSLVGLITVFLVWDIIQN